MRTDTSPRRARAALPLALAGVLVVGIVGSAFLAEALRDDTATGARSSVQGTVLVDTDVEVLELNECLDSYDPDFDDEDLSGWSEEGCNAPAGSACSSTSPGFADLRAGLSVRLLSADGSPLALTALHTGRTAFPVNEITEGPVECGYAFEFADVEVPAGARIEVGSRGAVPVPAQGDVVVDLKG